MMPFHTQFWLLWLKCVDCAWVTQASVDWEDALEAFETHEALEHPNGSYAIIVRS